MSITLALESAIAGGSISLLDGAEEIACWIGSSDVSKAEDLLINIDTLLSNNDLSRRDIELIAVSAGPGSFTGIRIGIATALGLKNGLGISMGSVSALEAITSLSTEENITVAVPMGRNAVCLQQFKKEIGAQPYTLDHDRFVELVIEDTQNIYVVHEKLYSQELTLAHITNFGSNVAKAIGLSAIKNPNRNIEPLFISKAAQ